jgi:hypothetical protein
MYSGKIAVPPGGGGIRIFNIISRYMYGKSFRERVPRIDPQKYTPGIPIK